MMSKYVAKEFAGSVTLLFQVASDCFCVNWGKNGKYLNWVQIGFEMDYNLLSEVLRIKDIISGGLMKQH